MVLSVYLLLLLMVAALVYSLGRLAVILPQYTPKIEEYLRDIGSWLEEIGIGTEQVNSAIGSFDVSNLVGLASSVFGATLEIL